MADDDVQLTDLEVIQQFSLAVRGATASRADVIAALEADLAHLGGSRRAAPARGVATAEAESAPVKAQARPAAKATVPAPAKAPTKRAVKKAPAKTARRA
jgi:hypothetical protein